MDVKLVMFRAEGGRREFPLKTGKTMIGRKDDCAIRIPLSEVSRHHCEIVVKGNEVTLRDLKAANGTILNGRRVEEESLEPGDQLKIGPVIFTVQVDGAPSDAEIVAIRTKLSAQHASGPGGPGVATSKHVYMSDEEIDPISALEALASSADQTAINPEDVD